MVSLNLATRSLGILCAGLFLVPTEWSLAAENEKEPAKPATDKKPQSDPLFPFTISKETTRITEPLKPDGTVDYAAALNTRMSEGLAPENNAGVLLMKAFGAEAVPAARRERFYKTLGMPVPERTGGLLKDFSQVIEPELQKTGNESDVEKARQSYFDQQGQAQSRPWSRKEFPLVANWVDANAGAVSLAVEASMKPRLFLPLIVAENESMIEVNLEGVQRMRHVARLLTASAMLALEEGRIEDAQSHLLACHRLASLMGHGSILIEALVSYALDAVACEGDLALAQSPKVTAEQLAKYRGKLAELPALPKIGESIDQGERFYSLDAISHLATQKMDAAKLGLPQSKLLTKMLGLSIDWDLILKRFNTQYDEMAAALQQPTFAGRMGALAKIEEELEKIQKEANQPAQFALMFLGVDPPRAVVSRQIGNVLLGLLMPAVTRASQAEARSQTRRDLTIVALALAEYQREQGEYPGKLSDLSPKYLKSLPPDRFTDKPLKYRTQEGGYVLYSVGLNQKDEKGAPRGADSDDQTLRVPSKPEL